MFFFFESPQCFMASSWSTKRMVPIRAQNQQNALVPDGCSCGSGNQAQLTIVVLVSPVAQETRIAKPPNTQYKVDSQEDLGLPRDPGGYMGVQETEVRGDQAAVGCSRKTQSMGSCDVHKLPESFASLTQRRRMLTHAKQAYLHFPPPPHTPWGVKITTFRPLGRWCFLLRVALTPWTNVLAWLLRGRQNRWI